VPANDAQHDAGGDTADEQEDEHYDDGSVTSEDGNEGQRASMTGWDWQVIAALRPMQIDAD
jgi:hypothetical protein